MCFREALGPEAETSKAGVDWLPDLGLWFADVAFVKGKKNTLPSKRRKPICLLLKAPFGAPLALGVRFWVHLKLQIRNCKSVFPSPFRSGSNMNANKPVKLSK